MTIKLNGSVGGSVSIDAPPSTTSQYDINFKLPVADGTAGQVLMTDGSGNLSWVTPGITMAQQWRVTNSFDLSASTETNLTSNWEAADAYNAGSIGSNLSESSGIFSFPSTGIYMISATSTFLSQWPDSASTDNWGIFMRIKVTTNNSTYVTGAETASFLEAPASKHGAMNTHYIFDVTDTSTCKFQISLQVMSATVTFRADTNSQITGFSVIRLGDT